MTHVYLSREITRRYPDRLLASFTLARLLLVPVLVTTFMVNPALTTVSLLAFMAADLYDGILARKLGNDGLGRRALDSIADRIAIDSCLIAAYFAGALPLLLLCGFIARDICLAVVCARIMSQRRVAIKADMVHRSLSFLFAAWAIAAPFLSPSARVGFAAVVFAVAIGVAADVMRTARVVLNAPRGVRDRVLVARSLREYATREDENRARRAFAPVPTTT